MMPLSASSQPEVDAPVEPAWQAWLNVHFPGFLLPAAQRQAIGLEQAARFLERLSGRPRQLHLVLAAALLAGRMESLQHWTQELLPDLIRVLPSTSRTERRQWRGGFHGRLLVPATLALHLAGDPTSFVTQVRRRDLQLPESVLVVSVAGHLLRTLDELLHAGILAHYGWGASALACREQLLRLLYATRLRDIVPEPVTTLHLQAAHAARHPAYGEAARWYGWLYQAFQDPDPRRIAELLARGALAPLEPETRFELAVLLKLLDSLALHLQTAEPGRWTLDQGLVLPQRDDVATWTCDDGRRIRLHYNRAVLPPGPRDEGVAHYLGSHGRLRPDITVVRLAADGAVSAAVVEIKLSTDPSYLIQGFQEALLYRGEYAPYLTGWPKSLLVVPGPVSGKLRLGDPVVVQSWAQWPAPALVAGLVG